MGDPAILDECKLPLLGSEDDHEMTSALESNMGTECEMVLLEEEDLPGPCDEWIFVRLRPKHNIFLSHSGAQKDFVEQLCEDLERANESPFFDKRSRSLPKGEEFARRIFTAAKECQLAIVVVSEEYFTRTKWPMQELVAFGKSPGCKILPLFFGMSCEEFKNPERRERWFQVWNAWAQKDSRICVDTWKKALRELDGRNGMEYVKPLGEVVFRKEVITTVCSGMQWRSSQDEFFDVENGTSPANSQGQPETPEDRFAYLLSTLRQVIGSIVWILIKIVCFSLFAFYVFFPAFFYFAQKLFRRLDSKFPWDSFDEGAAFTSPRAGPFGYKAT